MHAASTVTADAAHRVGFFYLAEHGITEARMTELLDVAREFFALPQAEKDALSMVNSPHFRGYTRLGGITRGAVDWREQIDLGPRRRRPPATARLPQSARSQPVDAGAAPVAGGDRGLGCGSVPGVDGALRAWARLLGASPSVFDAAFTPDPATLIKIAPLPRPHHRRADLGRRGHGHGHAGSGAPRVRTRTPGY